VYRNLWIVDGNFLLEAARYLGYDKEADDGLLSEWAKQVPSGRSSPRVAESIGRTPPSPCLPWFDNVN